MRSLIDFMHQPHAPQDESNRRRLVRAHTWREAVISTLTGGHMVHGTVVDISPSGMQVHTRHPEKTGKSVQIELSPKETEGKSEPVVVRGAVVWVKELNNGVYAMGIHLSMQFMTGEMGATSKIHSVEEAEGLLSQISSDLKQRDLASAAVSLMENEGADPALEEALPLRMRVLPSATERWLRRLGSLVMLIGLCMVGLFLLRGCPGVESEKERSKDTVDLGAAFRVFENGETLTPDRLEEARGRARVVLEEAQRAMVRGDIVAIEESLETLEKTSFPDPVSAFAARLEEAKGNYMIGKKERAFTALATASRDKAKMPQAWREAADQVRQAMTLVHDPPVELPLVYDAFLLGSLEDVAPLEAAPEASSELAMPSEDSETAPLKIEISKHDFLMSVYVGEEKRFEFPVGLGAADTTPEGVFRIANKISNPAWYNRGQVVAADDPSNPLGEQWLGLGDGDGPTSYGIHSTIEPSSIGKNESRGCIRMFADHATTLFELCEVGVPVYIRD